MTLREAGAALGVSPATLQIQIAKRKLRGKKVGPVWTVTPREVERYRRESLGLAKGGRPRQARRKKATRPLLQVEQAGTRSSSVPPSENGTE